ncbi:hypothetical protein MXD62_03490 [Frankia sp. Mgl5]|uniref:Uncharacterized protein n=1 Tax=Parafrankia soli TaxID=2599596 RepID=A0A1S1PMS1_9ACTN|nr:MULTISPECIES: hypothetical protein [Frankiaceae]MCK9926240.1 hypothetical protein [Frankia sp. Mgl5]OHV22449.1 hypothetical protein BBK14_06620 [Parafrankia soli]TCJ32767.1 hypothetical protein E0504_41090 [Parafrankia sp. BMG5.11]
MANRHVALILGGGTGPELTDAPLWGGQPVAEEIARRARRSPATTTPAPEDPAVGTAEIVDAIIAILGS